MKDGERYRESGRTKISHSFISKTIVVGNSAIYPIRFSKAVTLWNMPGSNLDRNTESSQTYISAKCRKLSQDRFLPHPFQFIIHQSLSNSVLYNLRNLQTKI
jgi:hypothetical protein